MKTPQKRSQNQTLLEKTQEYLRKSGLKARKQLGQHFLVDEDTLAIILETAGLTGRENVIEVGPGPGVLTEELCLRAGRVAAVELDDFVIRKADGGTVTVAAGDVHFGAVASA